MNLVSVAVVAQAQAYLARHGIHEIPKQIRVASGLLGTEFQGRHRQRSPSRQIPYIRRFCYTKRHTFLGTPFCVPDFYAFGADEDPMVRQ
jgi:hypothetical protein